MATFDIYVRVSRVGGRAGDSFISPEVQREQCEAWARSRGVDVGMVHTDLDQSGGKLRRPGLDACLERLRSGEAQGIVVAKLDRLSRAGVADALRLVEEIHELGAVLAAIDYGLDPTTPFGEFGMTLLLGLARMEHRRIGEAWAVARSRALDRGAKIGPTPYGYQRRPDGTLAPHPTQAATVREAFRRAGEDGLHPAMDYLAEAAPDRVWTTTAVRRFLANRVYLGEQRVGGSVRRGNHEALVPRAAWEAAQPPATRTRRAPKDYPLSGLASCGSCGADMIGAVVVKRRKSGEVHRRIRTYRCSARCPRSAMVVADALEAHVRAVLADTLRGAWVAQDDAEGDLQAAEEALREAELELDDFVGDTEGAAALRRVGRYDDALRARVEAVEVAQARYRGAAAKSARGFAVDESALVGSATPEELGDLARGGLETIRVERGRGHLDERVRLIPKGTEPDPGMATP